MPERWSFPISTRCRNELRRTEPIWSSRENRRVVAARRWQRPTVSRRVLGLGQGFRPRARIGDRDTETIFLRKPPITDVCSVIIGSTRLDTRLEIRQAPQKTAFGKLALAPLRVRKETRPPFGSSSAFVRHTCGSTGLFLSIGPMGVKD